MATFEWTPKLKKAAHDELLETANFYEVKKRKRLIGVRYLPTGQAKWIGRAHDYSVWKN